MTKKHFNKKGKLIRFYMETKKQKKVAIIISPNYKDYAKNYLHKCIKSIRQQDYEGEMGIFITDNETSPESFLFLSKTVPEAELVLNQSNDGFAKGVNDSIRLAMSQNFDYIAVVSIHSTVAPNYISELLDVLEADKKIGVAQALVLMPDKKIINSLGNVTHFLGFGYCEGYKKDIDSVNLDINSVQEIFYPSGASMIFRKEVLEKSGLLDEEYWMYNEDQEIGWRLRLMGYKCVLAPKAQMYSAYEFLRSIQKFYWMDRNRILAILECYHILTLILIFPVLITMELGLVLFSLKTGWFKEKMKVWHYFLTLRTWIYIIRARKRNQKLRVVKDKEIIKLISGNIWYQEVDDWKLRFINPVFNFYWSIIKKIVIW